MSKNSKINEEIVKLVRARLESMPSNIEMHIGKYGSLDKEKLIKHVEKQDTIGKLIIEIQMNALRSFKEL